MTPAQCVPGVLVWYSPLPSVRFVGRVSGAPRLMGLSWVVALRDMDPAYGVWRLSPRSTVPAAMVSRLELVEDFAISHAQQGALLRDKAIARVEAHAPEGFIEAAFLAVQRVAATQAYFITDAVWKDMLTSDARVVEIAGVRERRAMGAVMRRAVEAGLIEPTENFWPSAQPQCHRRPMRVWHSLASSATSL